ncbi:hypothetical protein [Entomobacter blattae]|uniref:hypothetical protein n=1 Tax=Entomobacter blattae TaxID=2762277 RepID=UPI00193B383B|nr:hypothetical protein [Entomobacter blattae]
MSASSIGVEKMPFLSAKVGAAEMRCNTTMKVKSVKKEKDGETEQKREAAK